MRLATVVALLVVFVALTGLVVFGAGLPGQGGTLEERWVSDTPRDNEANHHAVGVGPDGDAVVAPVTAVPRTDVNLSETDCALVRLAPSNGSVLWREGTAPSNCFSHALTEPAIADVDGDGRREVATSTAAETLVVREARSGRVDFRVPLVRYGYGRPTVADLGPAAGREIVTSDIRGNVVLVHADGTVGWRTALNETFGGRATVWDEPSVADVDADGNREIVVGTSAGPAVLSSSGTVEWAGADGANYLAVANVDDDAQAELLVARHDTVRVIDGRDHELQWQKTLEEFLRVRATADGDDDGDVELYAGLSNGTVLSMDAEDGAVEWSTTVSTAENAVVTAPVLADVDGSGPPEVVVATRDGTVAVLDAGSGAELAAYERSVPVWTFPTPADLDDDGDDEILARYGDGRVVALEYASGAGSGPLQGFVGSG